MNRGQWYRHYDTPLLILITLMFIFGLIVLYSATGHDAATVGRQTVRFLIGLAALTCMANLSPHVYLRAALPLYVFGMILLCAVFLFEPAKGAQRWIVLGSIRMQPSELMKIAVPLMVARYCHFAPSPIRGLHAFIAFGLTALPTLLIAKQPDLGTAILVSVTGICVLFFAGLPARWWYRGAIAFSLCAPLAWFFALHDYQKDRLLMFLSPEADPLGRGYHILQSKIAIGSGGFFGKGLGQGTQANLDFLPEPHTDFIFAVLSEELGLLGAAILFLGYGFIAWRCLLIGQRAQNSFAQCLAGSLSVSFMVYVVINIGMVTGLLPVVGLPLPLISYGGSSLVTLMACFGMLMSIETYRR
ncbi:MAG: rod shape-determining protein RodA [Pseudomonadota bacterium]